MYKYNYTNLPRCHSVKHLKIKKYIYPKNNIKYITIFISYQIKFNNINCFINYFHCLIWFSIAMT